MLYFVITVPQMTDRIPVLYSGAFGVLLIVGLLGEVRAGRSR